MIPDRAGPVANHASLGMPEIQAEGNLASKV